MQAGKLQQLAKTNLPAWGGRYPDLRESEFTAVSIRDLILSSGNLFKGVKRLDSDDMRVPEFVLKCVGYVCEVAHADEKGLHGDPHATGFFVALPCESGRLVGQQYGYFITAKHVARDLQDREIFFLVNRKGGGVTSRTHVPGPHWWTHPTDVNADIAAVHVSIPDEADVVPIPMESLGLPERLANWNIGIGDEVHALGLFSEAPGHGANMPIVRTGNIAMMPIEQIQTDLGYSDVYLVEARSIGGMSGSPVFVRPTLSQKFKTQDGKVTNGFMSGSPETLLGMVQGHWDIREEEINKPSFTHERKRGVNLGIAMVVPALKIYETLYQEKLVSIRREQELSTGK